MKNAKLNACALCVAVGSVSGLSMGEDSPTALSPSAGPVVQAAHIYYNIATGERVVTLLGDGQSSPAAGGTSVPVWSSLAGGACDGQGQGSTTSFFFVVDDNAGSSSLATGVTVLDFGDIELDTVVDSVHVDWVTGHNDVDADSDGIGDGVAGLAGEWTYWDAENGRNDRCVRLPLISFRFVDLPGNIFGDGSVTGYSADIDLGSSFTSSLTFELGDSDGDLQGAAFGSNDIDTNSDGIGDGVSIANVDLDFDGLPDSDLDGDGLFDWGWSVRFFQPGTADHDGDGVLDGDFADSMKPIGISFGYPEGVAVDNGDGTWTWEIDTSPEDAGTGSEDAFAMYFGGQHVGLFWFGGFSCTPDDGGNFTPRANFEAQLFGPGEGVYCPADFNLDGVFNFFDISAFLAAYKAGDLSADFNQDGELNFFDISAFLSAITDGCA